MLGFRTPPQEMLNHREAAKWEGKLPKGWTDESVKKFWNTMTGDVKHKVTKCIKEMEGKGVDPGAFCAALCDKVEGTSWRHEKRKTAGEQEDSDLLEDLAGGSRRAFKMMDIWKSVQNLGTRYDRLMDPDRYDPVRNFIIRARRERFSEAAIKHYVENIQGNRLPRDWKRLKAATSASRVAARYLNALKVEPLSAYEGEKIKQAIEFHNREAIDSSEMADDIEKAWKKWDLRTLGSYQVLSRREVQYVQRAMETEDSSDDRYLGEIGRTIKEHIEALRSEAWDHRKEAQAIEKAWKNHDMGSLKRMRVI